jgi:hypothetical protein
MARRPKREEHPLPPPLPPEKRTVGQLIGESIKLYGAHFVRALPLGIVVAAVNQLTIGVDRITAGAVLLAAAPVFSTAFAYACTLGSRSPGARSWALAIAVGVVVWIPAALFLPWFALAGVLWLALIGLAVPAALHEGASFSASLRRGLALGRVDYVHSAGALATLVILFFIMRIGLALLLESQADNTVRTAIFLADAVLAPLLFLGGAVLYVDQAARLDSRRDRTKE